MKFEDAMHIMSGLLDMYYEEYCDSGIETEEYKELEKAEAMLYLLIKELKNKGIINLKDLKEMDKVKFIGVAFN